MSISWSHWVGVWEEGGVALAGKLERSKTGPQKEHQLQSQGGSISPKVTTPL